MIILDANIVLCAWNRSDPNHERVRTWLESSLNGEGWIGIPWVTIWAFVRLVTNPRVFRQPIDAERAFSIVRGWLEMPNVTLIQPGTRHEEILRSIVIRSQSVGPLISDAVLAALTIEHGCKLASLDQDFTRFPGLDWFNPSDESPT